MPARQRTLRNTIAWSHDLLDEHEQRLFRRVSILVGGWTIGEVEAVCGDAAAEDDLGASEAASDASLEPRQSMLDLL